METVIPELTLLFGGMKQRMRNTRRSVGRVQFVSEKSRGFLAATLAIFNHKFDTEW